jgi:hypothetical protein
MPQRLSVVLPEKANREYSDACEARARIAVFAPQRRRIRSECVEDLV